MTKKKETLIYAAITSVAFLALSYLFGIVISFECNWFTNEFLFVIFSGAFASSLVVLISEIFGYRQLKKLWKTSYIVIFHTCMLLQKLQKTQ